jgi:hypothetical protein
MSFYLKIYDSSLFLYMSYFLNIEWFFSYLSIFVTLYYITTLLHIIISSYFNKTKYPWIYYLLIPKISFYIKKEIHSPLDNNIFLLLSLFFFFFSFTMCTVLTRGGAYYHLLVWSYNKIIYNTIWRIK